MTTSTKQLPSYSSSFSLFLRHALELTHAILHVNVLKWRLFPCSHFHWKAFLHSVIVLRSARFLHFYCLIAPGNSHSWQENNGSSDCWRSARSSFTRPLELINHCIWCEQSDYIAYKTYCRKFSSSWARKRRILTNSTESKSGHEMKQLSLP